MFLTKSLMLMHSPGMELFMDCEMRINTTSTNDTGSFNGWQVVTAKLARPQSSPLRALRDILQSGFFFDVALCLFLNEQAVISSVYCRTRSHLWKRQALGPYRASPLLLDAGGARLIVVVAVKTSSPVTVRAQHLGR